MHTTSSTSQDTTSTTSTTSQPTTPYTSTYKITTTLPDGQQSTVTAVTVVHPTETAREVATGTKASPGLQTDSAASANGFAREFALMMGGAAVVAMAL